jgi:Armadillo/beta-catenin-like repeat
MSLVTTLFKSLLHFDVKRAIVLTTVASRFTDSTTLRHFLWDLGTVITYTCGLAAVTYSASYLVFRVLATICHGHGYRDGHNASSSSENVIVSRWNMVATFVTFGGKLGALRLVERYIDDPDSAMNALSILQTMTNTDDYVRTAVAEMGGIETTVKALKKYSDENEGVASSGCGLLMNFCTTNDKARQRVLKCGGITTLVKAMRQWPDSEHVQAHACTALAYLASSPEAAIRKKIIDVGGLVALAEARTKHQHDDRVRLPAEGGLLALVQTNDSDDKSKKEWN